MIVRLTDHGSWCEAACRCGAVRFVIAGGAAQGVTDGEIADAVAELVAHARTCPDAAEPPALLLDRRAAELGADPREGMRI